MRMLFNTPLGISAQGIPKKMNGIGEAASALMGGIVSLIGNSETNRTNEDIALRNVLLQRETNAQNYRMFQEQQDYNREMYQRQLLDNREDARVARQQYLDDREYDSPTNKMRRLRDAGLNPFLSYGDTNNYGAGVVQSSPSSFSSPSRPDMVAPQYHNTYQSPLTGLGDTISKTIAMLYDLHFREEENKREWSVALANAPYDKKTKEILSGLHVFGDDKTQDLMQQMLEEQFNGVIKDNTLKQWQVNMQQEVGEEMRKQWMRNQEQHEAMMNDLAAKLINLGKEGKLMDEDLNLSKQALELIKDEVNQLKNFRSNAPAWVQEIQNFFKQFLGGSVMDLLKLFKRGK